MFDATIREGKIVLTMNNSLYNYQKSEITILIYKLNQGERDSVPV
jgi:hypothetical protein